MPSVPLLKDENTCKHIVLCSDHRKLSVGYAMHELISVQTCFGAASVSETSTIAKLDNLP